MDSYVNVCNQMKVKLIVLIFFCNEHSLWNNNSTLMTVSVQNYVSVIYSVVIAEIWKLFTYSTVGDWKINDDGSIKTMI